MAFCAWCGNHVPAVSYAPCPRCGNPTNGAQRVAGAGGGQGVGIVIGLLVGGLALVAILGILAAIAIPNLLTAMQRSRQKRTAADLRSLGVALEAYASDKDIYPPGSNAADLASALTPTYARTLPSVDGWGKPIRYECWPEGACTSYALASGGGDQLFEHDSARQYSAGTKTGHFDCDLVFANGEFVQFPEVVGGR